MGDRSQPLAFDVRQSISESTAIDATWPNAEASQFVSAAGITWHVQRMGQGPVLLLLHGTGAASHSFRDMAPLLARHFTVVVPDLPGHGFSEAPQRARLALDAMAHDLTALLRALDLVPAMVAGHSAGLAVLLRMCLDGGIAPHTVVGLNGAVLPFEGLSGQILLPLARLMAASDQVPRLIARFARRPGFVERLIDNTGSKLDPRGIELYRRLTSDAAHVGASIRMMANWRLPPLVRDLPRLRARLVLIAGERDRTIPSRDAGRVSAMVAGAQVVTLPGLGHLAHEEKPDEIAALMMQFARQDAGPAAH